MISKLAFFSANSNKYNYLSRFNFKLTYKTILNSYYFLKEINNYIENLFNINFNNYSNILLSNNIKINLKNSKKIENKLIFKNYLSNAPLYLENLIDYPKLDNTLALYEDYLNSRISKKNRALIEIRIRNNINLLLNYNISLNSYYDFISNKIYNILILAKYLSNKDNLKIISIHHLLLSMFKSNILSDNNKQIADNELDLSIINLLIKNENIKIKSLSNLSFSNLIIIYFNKSYLAIKILLIENNNLIKKTLISENIKILFQYVIKINQSIFKTVNLIPEYIIFVLLNINKLKISKIFLNLLDNKLKQNVIELNSYICNKNFKSVNKTIIDINQEYYLYLMERTVSQSKLKIFLDSIYTKHILNYFRFFILKNAIFRFTKSNMYKAFLKDILIINIYRY